MNWNCSRSAIRVSKEKMTPTHAHGFEPDFFKDADEFFALHPGQTRHTEIC